MQENNDSCPMIGAWHQSVSPQQTRNTPNNPAPQTKNANAKGENAKGEWHQLGKMLAKKEVKSVRSVRVNHEFHSECKNSTSWYTGYGLAIDEQRWPLSNLVRSFKPSLN